MEHELGIQDSLNTVGVLDCTCIRIKHPSEAHKGDVVNKKSKCSDQNELWLGL